MSVLENVDALGVKAPLRKIRPVRYHFRTSDKIFEMLSLIAEEDEEALNITLEKLIYLEYWKRIKFKRAQMELGEFNVI